MKTDSERHISYYESEIGRLNKAFENHDRDAQDLAERRQRLVVENDRLLSAAHDDLDDDDFYDAFGYYPDRSDHSPDDPRRSPWEKQIDFEISRLGAYSDRYPATHVDAMIRERGGRIADYTPSEFEAAIRNALRSLSDMTFEAGEALAVKHEIGFD